MRLAEIASRCVGEGIDRLESLCRELQIVAGESPFFLDCRTAANVLGVGKSTTNRWLTDLCDAGVLTLVRKGEHSKKLASEYCFNERAK